jgi:hypothetical protein
MRTDRFAVRWRKRNCPIAFSQTAISFIARAEITATGGKDRAPRRPIVATFQEGKASRHPGIVLFRR